MKLKQGFKSVLIILTLFGIGALLIFAFIEGRKELALERERERPIRAPSRLSTQDGERVVTLDRTTRDKSGIVVAPLDAISHQEALKAYGVVVELQNFIDLRSRYAAAKAQAGKTEAALETSRKTYERLKGLYENNRNISDKALQAAEGTWRSDRADAEAAQETLHTLENTGRQQWGEALAGGLFEGASAVERLMRQQDRLVQITLPVGSALSPPKTASVQTAEGGWTSAHLISPSPRTDPRIQGISFFYSAPAQTGLLPGMNVLASLPVGSRKKGVVVPASAVVLWEGTASVYLQKEADRFVRRAVPTDVPLTSESALPARSQKEGWFVAKSLSAGDRLVVVGAQLLLSEELRAQIQVGDEGK